ncbi:hypothetical protein ES705_38927 [subsurface metagenome]
MNAGEVITDEIIAITAHRDYPDRAAFLRGLDNLRAKTYYLGGARGGDTDALEHLAKTQPSSQRIVVVPNRLIDQPRQTIPIISRDATRVIELRNAGPDRYQIRNKYMVDNSQRVVAFYDNRGSGGTFNTIRYAESKGVPVSTTVLLDQDVTSYIKKTPEQFRANNIECFI